MSGCFTSILGGIIGLFAGYYTTLLLFSIFHGENCMWRMEAVGCAFLFGAPAGAIVCSLLGLWFGIAISKSSKKM